MIDISKLDQSKTYVGYEVGTNKVARKIQTFSKRDVGKLFSTEIPDENEIASHVFALAFDPQNSKWQTYEAHFVYDGVRKLDYTVWLQMQKRDSAKQYFVFPFELSVSILDFYSGYNPGYGSGQIENMSLGEIEQKGGLSWPEYPGVTSSGYLALADTDYKVCNKFCCMPKNIKPIHFQAYVYENLGKDHLIYASN